MVRKLEPLNDIDVASLLADETRIEEKWKSPLVVSIPRPGTAPLRRKERHFEKATAMIDRGNQMYPLCSKCGCGKKSVRATATARLVVETEKNEIDNLEDSQTPRTVELLLSEHATLTNCVDQLRILTRNLSVARGMCLPDESSTSSTSTSYIPHNDSKEYERQLILQIQLFLIEIENQRSAASAANEQLTRQTRTISNLKEDLQSAELQIKTLTEKMTEALRVASNPNNRRQIKENGSDISRLTGRVHTLKAAVSTVRLSNRMSISSNPGEVIAPTGKVTLIFTDIQGSTNIWEQQPAAMTLSLTAHNKLIRSCISRYHGYEVKTIGDAFMVAFSEPRFAVGCSLAIQLKLLEQDWPADLLTVAECCTERSSNLKGLYTFRV